MSILFISDKWCAGNSKFGLSAWEGNLLSSLESLNVRKVRAFHFDDYHLNFPFDSANKRLLEICKSDKPDFIFLIIYEMPSNDDKIISLESLNIIKNTLNIPIVTIFGDLQLKPQILILNAIEKYVDLILFTALPYPGLKIANKKMKYMWVPKDHSYFNFNANVPHIHDVSYVGSAKPDRMALVKYLKNKNIDIFSGGGERGINLSVLDYSDIIKKSKISLSFSRAGGIHCINARPFEILSCKSLLLEQYGIETPKLFTPYEDYIPYTSRRDCLDKINYFLKHDNERLIIANNGYLKYTNFFTSKRFWDEVITYMENKDYLSNYVIPFNKFGNSFWKEPLNNRSSPIFDLSQYRNFSKFRIKLFQYLNFVLVNPILFQFYYYFFQFAFLAKRIIRLPYSVPRRLYIYLKLKYE
jgi:hypothetical protein